MKTKILSIIFTSLSLSLMAMIYIDYQENMNVLSQQSETLISETQIENEVKRSTASTQIIAQKTEVSTTTQAPAPKKFKCPYFGSPEYKNLEHNIEAFMWNLDVFKFVTDHEVKNQDALNHKVRLTLSQNCEILIGEEKMAFDISIINLSERYKVQNMAIFRPFESGYEIIELTRVQKDKVTTQYSGVSVVSSGGQKEFQATQVIFAGNVLKATGTLDVTESEMNVNLLFQMNGKEKTISADLQRKGQAFIAGEEGAADYMIGIASETQDGFSLTFSSGEFKGHVIEFMTDSAIQLKNSREEAVQGVHETAEREIASENEISDSEQSLEDESEVIKTAKAITADSEAVTAKPRGVRF